jgi:hypothetical protein
MSPANTQRAALAAKSAGTGHRQKPHWYRPRIRRTGPNEGDDPADNGPTQKQIHNENQAGIGFVPANDGREKVHQAEK